MKVLKKRYKTKWNPLRLLPGATSDISMDLGIYAEKDFHHLIRYERMRSDRTGAHFSLVLFILEKHHRGDSEVKSFIKDLKLNVRTIDQIGWYDDTDIGVLLPETDYSGAKRFAEIIEERMSLDETIFLSAVYFYPNRWFKMDHDDSEGNITRGDFGSDDEQVSDASMMVGNANTIVNVVSRGIPHWKRIVDIVGSLVGMLLLTPLFLLLAIYIKIVSPGPVIFTQERVGYQGRKFNFYKFRTMKIGNNQGFHGKHTASLIRNDVPMEKLDSHDPRIIPGGRILRKTSVDELPQLINILKGEMSLVGPRPCIPSEADEYLRWHANRFDIVPGLTGLWQVSGKNKLTFKQMIRLDITYARKMSFWFDLMIILKTIPTVIKLTTDGISRRIRIGYYTNKIFGSTKDIEERSFSAVE